MRAQGYTAGERPAWASEPNIAERVAQMSPDPDEALAREAYLRWAGARARLPGLAGSAGVGE